MWALVEDNSIVKIINNPKGMVIGDTRYSKNIFSFRWTNEEREAIGIYEIVFNDSNRRDTSYYTNTNQLFNFADGVVTASYGTATARELDDVTDEEDNVKVGLKSRHKEIIKQEASVLLTPTDWHVIKATDVESYSVPSAVSTFRNNVRTKSNEMETAIDNAADVDALAALYKYTRQEDGSQTRPLGEFPVLDI